MFLGAVSRCPLYPLTAAADSGDAASIGARGSVTDQKICTS